MLNLLKGLARDTNGATAVEYVLLAAALALFTVTVLSTVSLRLSQTFDTVSGKL